MSFYALRIMEYGKFEVSVLIVVALLSSYSTYLFHCYWIRMYSLHSDYIHRLVRQLILASGQFYVENIYPEVSIIMIRAAETLMPPLQVDRLTNCNYQLLMPLLEQRLSQQLNL